MDLLLSVLKEFGFPIALCVVLFYVIKHQNRLLVTSYTDRIRALESLTKDLAAKISALEKDRIDRSDAFTKVLTDLVQKYQYTIAAHNVVTKDTLGVLRRLADDLGDRPCLGPAIKQPDGHRYERTPSSAEIPADPPTGLHPTQ